MSSLRHWERLICHQSVCHMTAVRMMCGKALTSVAKAELPLFLFLMTFKALSAGVRWNLRELQS